ncbi:MAG: hypothetical protein ABGY24_12640, partial [bacterium]
MKPAERGGRDPSAFKRSNVETLQRGAFRQATLSLLVLFLGIIVAVCVRLFDLRFTRDLDLLLWKLRHLNERHLWPVGGPRLASLASNPRGSSSDQASWGTFRP